MGQNGRVPASGPGFELEEVHSSIVCKKTMWETPINRNEQVDWGRGVQIIVEN